MATKVRDRSEIEEKYKWDVESIFTDDEAWETAIEQLLTEVDKAADYKGKLGDGAAVLADFLGLTEQIYRRLSRVYMYPMLQSAADANDQKAQAQTDRGRGVYGRTQAKLSFVEPELLSVGFDTLNQWLKDEDRLAPYAHFIERLEKTAAHVRSDEVEEMLGMLSDVFSTMASTHGVLANADMEFDPAVGADGEKHDVSQGTIRAIVGDPDRDVRRTGYESYAGEHLAYKNTMANTLAAGVKRDVFLARVRRYENSLDAALGSNHIPTAVFHNLIDVYKKNLPTWHKYWRVRREALGYDKLYEYDLKAPLSHNPPQVSYEQAVDWIAEGMAPLGDEYVSVMRRGALEERWVDVYPNKGKRMGAFSAGVPGTHPFIMMSYTPDLFGLSTLAHELGHSMHSYFTWQNQSIFPYTRYGLFAAEVASNFNQAMVRDHLLSTNDDVEFQIAVIEEAMANFHRYFFIMPTLARFELTIHERVEQGKALTADYLIGLMADLFREGYGEELTMDDEMVGITWAEFHTHLYSNFYVYQYATGISAAHALAQAIRAERPSAADNYLSFLKAGGSMYPLDVLKLAGVDMTSPEPVEKTFAVLAQHVDRLEGLLAER